MKSKLVFGCAFALVFLLGMLAGGAVFARWGQRAAEHRAAVSNVQQQWGRLSDELKLTPEQRQRIRIILSDTFEQRRSVLRETRKLDRTLEDKIMAELEPAQKEKFREIRSRGRDLERRWQKWMRDQRRQEREPPGSGQ